MGAPPGGTLRAVVRHEPVTAWLSRAAAGQDAVYEQLDGGRPRLLYRETRPGVRLTALAPLDGGRVGVVALRTAGGGLTASVLLLTPGVAQPAVLAASAHSPQAHAYNPSLSSSGQSLAFRRRVGSERGLADQIVVIDVLRGTTRVVASALLRTARLSDPSLGYGRVVWSSARIAGSSPRALERARRPGVTDIARWCARSSVEVAHDLIGCELLIDAVGGRIVECEAYGRDDPASHSFPGPTPRNATMFGPAGRVYVYLSYGVHWMLNIVCGAQEGAGEAVLIRALEPTIGIDQMRKRRGREALADLCRGPGRLGQALAVGPDLNGEPIGAGRIELRPAAPPGPVAQTERIGISRARELPWRFLLVGLALRQPVPSLTISVTSAPLAASFSGIGYCE